MRDKREFNMQKEKTKCNKIIKKIINFDDVTKENIK